MGSYGWYVSKRWKGPQRVHSAPASMPQQFHRKIRAATAVSQWSHSNTAAIPQQRRKNTFRDPKGIPQESCMNDSTVCNPIEMQKKHPQQYWRNPIEVLKWLHNKYTIISQQHRSNGSCQILILHGRQPKNYDQKRPEQIQSSSQMTLNDSKWHAGTPLEPIRIGVTILISFRNPKGLSYGRVAGRNSGVTQE